MKILKEKKEKNGKRKEVNETVLLSINRLKKTVEKNKKERKK